jgi:hypothetical protein
MEFVLKKDELMQQDGGVGRRMKIKSRNSSFEKFRLLNDVGIRMLDKEVNAQFYAPFLLPRPLT